MARTGDPRIEWTGERCVPWGDEVQGIYEHLHRYRFASRFVEGRRVLDVASGEGYGSAILAERAAQVVGIEIDADSVVHSRISYALPNLMFVEGSMLELLERVDGLFDVVVCFEAIEHINEQKELIEAIAEVLAPDGVFLLSTPDRVTYNASIHEPNRFHVSELNRTELHNLLCETFPHMALWGQNVIGGSRIVRLDGSEDPAVEELVVRRDGEWVALDGTDPMYLVAAASRVPLREDIARSYLIDPTGEALRLRDQRVHHRDLRIRELKDENAALHRENARLRKEPWRQLAVVAKTRARRIMSAAGSRGRDT